MKSEQYDLKHAWRKRFSDIVEKETNSMPGPSYRGLRKTWISTFAMVTSLCPLPHV